MHSKFIDQKKQIVSSLSNDFQKFGSFLIFEYKSLNCEVITNLRKEMRSIDAKILVRKNNVIFRALSDAKISKDVKLCGQNAILFAHNDINALKTINKLNKNNQKIKLKMAQFDNTFFSQDVVDTVMTLKSKDELVTQFAQMLMTPVYKLLFILNKIKDE